MSDQLEQSPMSDEDGQLVDSQEMEDLSEEQSKLFALFTDTSQITWIFLIICMLAHFSLGKPRWLRDSLYESKY